MNVHVGLGDKVEVEVTAYVYDQRVESVEAWASTTIRVKGRVTGLKTVYLGYEVQVEFNSEYYNYSPKDRPHVMRDYQAWFDPKLVFKEEK